jgi:hypothetical protein
LSSSATPEVASIQNLMTSEKRVSRAPAVNASPKAHPSDFVTEQRLRSIRRCAY